MLKFFPSFRSLRNIHHGFRPAEKGFFPVFAQIREAAAAFVENAQKTARFFIGIAGAAASALPAPLRGGFFAADVIE